MGSFFNLKMKKRIQNLLLTGFLVRFLACLVYYFFFEPNELKPIINGAYQGLGVDGYFQIARTLWLSGEYAFEVHGAPVHSRPPLHPLLLFITCSWSDNYWFFQWFFVSSLLGTLSIYLTYQVAKFFLTPSKALKAAFLVAFHPYLIIIARSTTFVHLATVLLLSSFYVYWCIREKTSKYILLGFLCGLCLLTHATFQILPLVLGILLMYKKKFFYAFIVLLFTFLTVLPWSIRNYLTFRRPIFLVTGMGMQFWKGEESVFRHKVDIYRKVYEGHTHKPLKIAYFCTIAPADDDLLWELGIQKILKEPLEMVKRFFYGIIIFLFPHETGWQKFIFTFVFNLPIYLGIFYTRRKYGWQTWHLEILFYFLWVLCAFAFFTPHAGYIVVFLPLLILLCV